MTSAALAGLLLRQPFHGFTFHFGGDEIVFVSRADQVKHEPGNRIVTITDRSDGREFIIDLDRVVMIEVSPKR